MVLGYDSLRTRLLAGVLVGLLGGFVGAPAVDAALIGVAGPNSSLGVAPAIIAAPLNILDDNVVNEGMQGFDEAQGVLTSVAHAIDGGGFIAAGSLVDSHMIFLNNRGQAGLVHNEVTWSFDGTIIGVMSDVDGNLEAASSFELGNPSTN